MACGVWCVACGGTGARCAAHIELEQLEAPRDLLSIEPCDLAPEQSLHQHRGMLKHRVGRLPSLGHGACGGRGNDAEERTPHTTGLRLRSGSSALRHRRWRAQDARSRRAICAVPPSILVKAAEQALAV